MEQLGKFSTNTLNATPPMTVTVTRAGKEVKTYRTPKGFRMDQYVGSLHPDFTMAVTLPVRKGAQRPDFRVAVIDEKGDEVEVHHGIYDTVEE